MSAFTALRAGAFTLTELLVALTILGLLSALVAAGAPAMLGRARLAQAAARLSADLDLGAMSARRNGAFGQLVIASSGDAYEIRIGSEIVAERSLPSPVRIEAATSPVLDPAGRWSPTAIALEGPNGRIVFTIDAVTGRATRAGHGANGSLGRRRFAGRGAHRLLRRPSRRPVPSRDRTHERAGDYPRSRGSGRRAPKLVLGALFRCTGDLSWRLSCRAANQAQSARLLLITCTATIARNQRDIVSLDQTWAEPRSRQR